MQTPSHSSAPPPPPPPLPPGWVSATDPASGRVYYANPMTGETSWTPPLFPPPPPMIQPTQPFVTTPSQQQQQQQSSSLPLSKTVTLSGPMLVSHVQTLLETTTTASAAAVGPSSIRNQHGDDSLLLLEERLSVGTMADLCNLQKEREDSYYEPLEPQRLDPSTAIPPVMEHGRLEIRLQSLYEKLQKIKHDTNY